MSELKIYGHDPIVTAWGTPTPQREPKLKVTVNWSTRIVESPRSGREFRTPLITEPRYEIEGSDFVLTDESYATLSQAFQSTGGRARSFPFKNPIDYYCRAEGEVFTEGVSQAGFIIPINANQGQVVKRYEVNGVNSYKTILHPIASTMVVYNGETLIEDGYSVDEETGIVDFVEPLPDWLLCSCEFRMRFRFDVSDLQLSQIKRALDEFDVNVYQSVNFRLIEDSYDKAYGTIFASDWGVSIGFDLANTPLPDITYSDRIPSRIERAGNQKELREEVEAAWQTITLESGNTNWVNTQAFLTIFNVTKGSLNLLTLHGLTVRLNADSVGIEQLGIDAFAVDSVTSTSQPPIAPVVYATSSIVGGNGDFFPHSTCGQQIGVYTLIPFQFDWADYQLGDPPENSETLLRNAILSDSYFDVDGQGFVIWIWEGQSTRLGHFYNNPSNFLEQKVVGQGGWKYSEECIQTVGWKTDPALPALIRPTIASPPASLNIYAV